MFEYFLCFFDVTVKIEDYWVLHIFNIGEILNMCVGEIDLFSGNKETLDINQFLKDPI